MRLINTATRALEEFIGQNIPPYAILSHTWEDGEVSFKEYTEGSHLAKKGYRKIDMTCKLAALENIEYAWIDTCCIDKSSSAELSESINSMYRWYFRSKICYVYFSDLKTTDDLGPGLPSCRWFSRGWTLQELIAPANIHFYDQDWLYRGDKNSLLPHLLDITRISREVLRHETPLSSIPVARRMSWAAYRQTTRLEDVAYCLLGIFDVNMPLLYGEEEKAFRRLQEEILKSTPDLSILGWKLPRKQAALTDSQGRSFSGVLAPSPDVFLHADRAGAWTRNDLYLTEFFTSSQGLQIRSRLFLEPVTAGQGYRSILPVYIDEGGRRPTFMYIRLRKLGLGSFVREDPYTIVRNSVAASSHDAPRTRRLVTVGDAGGLLPLSRRPSVLQLHTPPELDIMDVWPWARWDDEGQVFFSVEEGDEGSTGVARIRGRLVLDNPTVEVHVDCVIYCLGWGAVARPHFTILNLRDHATAINELNTRIAEYDLDFRGVMDSIVRYNLPESHSVVLDVRAPGKKVVVSVSADQDSDVQVHDRPFWRVKVKLRVCAANDAPRPHDAGWSDLEYLFQFPS